MGKRTALIVASCLFIMLVLAGTYLVMDVIYLYWRAAAEPQYDAYWWAEVKYVYLCLSVVALAWIADSYWLFRRWRMSTKNL